MDQGQGPLPIFMKINVAAFCALLASFSFIAVSCSSLPANNKPPQSYVNHIRLLSLDNTYVFHLFEIDMILDWIKHPVSAAYLVHDGRSILESFCIQDFTNQGCDVLCLYEAGILPLLEGWEHLTFQDFEEVARIQTLT